MFIENRSYDRLHKFSETHEVNVLNQFQDYEGDHDIGDTLLEIANMFIPDYNDNLWEGGQDIQEFIDSALKDEWVTAKDGIIEILRAGFYEYYKELLYSNLEQLIFNYAAKLMNEQLDEIDYQDYEILQHLNIELDERLEDALFGIGSTNYISAIAGAVSRLMEELETECMEERRRVESGVE
jgi:hypothetical protein